MELSGNSDHATNNKNDEVPESLSGTAEGTENQEPYEEPSTLLEAQEQPDWLTHQFTDALTGEPFSIQGFPGKVVLVEFITFRCQECLNQQQEIKELQGLLGEREDFIGIMLNIDPEEDPLLASIFAEYHGFNMLYGNPPVEIIRDIGAFLGVQYLDPNSIPVVVIDKDGNLKELPFGLKTADELFLYVEKLLE